MMHLATPTFLGLGGGPSVQVRSVGALMAQLHRMATTPPHFVHCTPRGMVFSQRRRRPFLLMPSKWTREQGGRMLTGGRTKKVMLVVRWTRMRW